jgi:hypothetical protein
LSFADRPVMRLADDRLGRAPLVEALSAALQEPEPDTSLLAAILGEAGSGKSSVLHMLRGTLTDRAPTVWLDAWEHGFQSEAPWHKLLLTLTEALANEHYGLPAIVDTEYRRAMVRRELEELSTQLYRGAHAWMARGFARPQALELTLGVIGPKAGEKVSVGDLIKRLTGKEGGDLQSALERRELATYRDEVTGLDHYRTRLRDLMVQEVGLGPQRLYVFVDHLDRCGSERALRTIEALRLYLDLPGSAFVLALDPAQLQPGAGEAAEEGRSGRLAPGSLLDKIIELAVALPPPGATQIAAFVTDFCEERGRPEIAAAAPILAAGGLANPRRIKRLLTALDLLARQGMATERIGHLAKLLALKAGNPGDWRSVAAAPGRIKQLEAASREAGAARAEERTLDPRRRLVAMLALEPAFAQLPEPEIAELVALCETVA